MLQSLVPKYVKVTSTCSHPGCDSRLRSDNTVGVCKQHRGCSIEGCEGVHRANGMCRYHNLKVYHQRQTAICTVEGCIDKLLAGGMCRRHLRKTPGYAEKEEKQKLKYLATHRDRMVSDPLYREKVRARKRQDSTGMDGFLVAALRAFQKGMCAVCKRTMNLDDRRAHDGECADHCHGSSSPRGLLCSICNRSLGFYETHQRPAGVVFTPYEEYLACPPATKLIENDTKT